jgi:ribosome maturation factor RimP
VTTDQLERTLKAERALGDAFEQFAGQWVAIVDHEVVEHNDTLNGLIKQIDLEKIDRIQHVTAEKAAFCFF